MEGDRVAREMDDDVRGWPLGEDKIRAKYIALVQRDLERKMLRAQGEILEHIPVTLPKSRSTREAYSRARSLQRVLRRAGLKDTTGKGSQSVPIPSPSSSLEEHHDSLADPEIVLALDVPKPVTVSAPSSTRSQQPERWSEPLGKQTKFLAKQFKLISNTNTTPRRNIKILGKPKDETKVTEKDQLQERIRVHDCDRSSNPSFLSSFPAQSSSLCLSSLVMSGKTATSPSGYAHANSPSSIISEESIPETVLSSPENEPTGRKLTKVAPRRAGAFNRRERWKGRKMFGSFDFGVDLDIDRAVLTSSESSWSLDGSTSSGMLTPRQSSASSSCSDDDDHHAREAHRMKVTSPSSLFRDGPRKLQATSPDVPRKLSRKLSTSFNKRRSKQVQSHPRDESLSIRSPERTLAVKESSKASLPVEIAGLMSEFRRVPSAISQQQAHTMAFQDDIAHLMLDRSESNEIGDIEEFLDGYMRLRSPFYLEVVEEFFRNVSYDCYKRPLDVKKTKLPPKVPRR